MALTHTIRILPLLIVATAAAAWPQSLSCPPIDRYLMVPDSEVALARSAAPAASSDRATIKVLTRSGYEGRSSDQRVHRNPVSHAARQP